MSLTPQAGIVVNVPLDGSEQIKVPFLSPFAQYVASVQLTYNPTSETDIQAVGSVIGTPSVDGFVMAATGGTPGSTGNFTYMAMGY